MIEEGNEKQGMEFQRGNHSSLLLLAPLPFSSLLLCYWQTKTKSEGSVSGQWDSLTASRQEKWAFRNEKQASQIIIGHRRPWKERHNRKCEREKERSWKAMIDSMQRRNEHFIWCQSLWRKKHVCLIASTCAVVFVYHGFSPCCFH